MPDTYDLIIFGSTLGEAERGIERRPGTPAR